MLSSNAHVIRRAGGAGDPLMTAIAETGPTGIDTAQLFGTFDAVTADPSLGPFEFGAGNRWIDGAHDRTLPSD